LIGVDLAAACAEYERQMGGGGVGFDAGVMSAYRHIELRAYRIDAASGLTGRPVRVLFPGLRVFVERIRRGDDLIDATADTVLEPGDTVAIIGPRQLLVERIEADVPEVHDPQLLNLPATAIDVFVTKATVGGKTLRELADEPFARGIHLRRIVRNMVEMPILPETEVLRGDILTISGSVRHVEAAVAALGFADRPLEPPISRPWPAASSSVASSVPSASSWVASQSGSRHRAARCSPASSSGTCGRSGRPSDAFQPRHSYS
jgi:putative transport protein